MEDLFNTKPTLDNLPLEIYMSFIEQNGQPALILRRRVFEPNLLKQIVEKHLEGKEIRVILKFGKSELHFMRELLSKGIVYEENGKLFFTDI